jgi:hypothetical protein
LGAAQPHGRRTTSWNSQLGTGHRSGGQSAGIVVRVTVGHGVVLGRAGGSVVTPVVTTGGPGCGRDVGPGGPGRPRVRDVSTGQGRSWMRMSTEQPLLGHYWWRKQVLSVGVVKEKGKPPEGVKKKKEEVQRREEDTHVGAARLHQRRGRDVIGAPARVLHSADVLAVRVGAPPRALARDDLLGDGRAAAGGGLGEYGAGEGEDGREKELHLGLGCRLLSVWVGLAD